MKKFFILFSLIILVNKCLNAQISAFKLKSQHSVITSSTEQNSIVKDGKKENTYVTPEIIMFNYLNILYNRKTDSIKIIQGELKDNSLEITKPQFSPDDVNERFEILDKLEDEIDLLEVKKDSLYYIYVKDYLKYKKFNILFGPLRSRAFFDIVYDNKGSKFKAVGNAGLGFGNSSGSLYSELVSGNLGLFRVALGTMVSKSNSKDSTIEKEQEAYQRLVSYGGNTVLTLEYPLAFFHSMENDYNFLSRFIAKGTADFPAFGTTTDKWAGSASIGLDFYGDASTRDNVLKFFFHFKVNRIFGTTEFRDNLEIDNTDFTFGQLSIGLIFLENFKISFAISTISSEVNLRNKNIIIGGQVLR